MTKKKQQFQPTNLEEALTMIARGIGEVQRGLREVKGAVRRVSPLSDILTKEPVVCLKCTAPMDEQPLERTEAGKVQRLYKCPTCGEKQWI